MYISSDINSGHNFLFGKISGYDETGKFRLFWPFSKKMFIVQSINTTNTTLYTNAGWFCFIFSEQNAD